MFSGLPCGESGGSAAWRVRYSTYSTYSKDPGESGVRGLARQGGAPGVPRTCSSDMCSDMLKQLSAYSKEPGSLCRGGFPNGLYST